MMDGDECHNEPDNCAICHVVMSTHTFCSSSHFSASRWQKIPMETRREQKRRIMEVHTF